MPTVYVRAQTGNDSNDGTTEATAVATMSKAKDLADAINLAQGGSTPVRVDAKGYFYIPSGGTASSVQFYSARVYDDFELVLGANTWMIYGTLLTPASDGYQTQTLALPTGCTIEAVEFDFEMLDPSHVTSDGRRKLYLKKAVDAAACAATSNTFFHTGSTLHVNITGTAGYIVVRYRPNADILMIQVSGQNLRLTGAGPSTSGILYPMYVVGGIACYGVQFNGSSSKYTGYTVSGVRFDGCWHAIGVLSTGAAGTLQFNNITVTNCEFNTEVISDVSGGATISYNPIVVYSGNTTGVVGTPVYLDITNWVTERCTFNCYRPVYYDGTSFSNTTDVFGTAIAGGTTGNNVAQILYSHGGNAFLLPRIFGGRTSYLNTINAWDYSVQDPHFAQRTYQSISYTPHTNSAWGSWAEDCTYQRRLTYSAGYSALDYGKFFYSSDCNIRWKRCVYRVPDIAVHSGGTGTGMFTLTATLGNDVIMETEECVFSIEGQTTSPAAFRRFFQFTNAGSGTPLFTFHARHMSFCSAATTLSESIVFFDSNGTLTAKIRCYGCIFHSNDSVNTTYWVFMFDSNTTQIPLYSIDPSYLVMQNNWYSNIGASRYDVSGVDRDTATEWSQNSGDGPHDGTLGNGAGRDAKYASAGTWSDTTLSFGATDSARTTKISTAVTLTYSPTVGHNLRSFDRHFGAGQYGGGSGGALAAIDVF